CSSAGSKSELRPRRVGRAHVTGKSMVSGHLDAILIRSFARLDAVSVKEFGDVEQRGLAQRPGCGGRDVVFGQERQVFALDTTPGRLRLFLAMSWLLAGVLGLVVAVGAYDHRAAVTAIGVEAAPAVQAAHRVKIEIESLDADLINEMLAPDAGDTWAKD